MDIQLTDSEKIKILNSDDIYGIMQKILLREQKIDQNREHFWVIGLENNHRILFIELVSLGTVNQALVKPMEVFSLALQKRAVKIILCHNHPSGELKPSDADKDITDKLIQVGIIVNTPVLDHLIISTKSYLSFGDIGLFQELELSTKYVPPYKL
ncbi:MAG: DNA repair protein RadC, partial [uncultured Aureispira sp.]